MCLNNDASVPEIVSDNEDIIYVVFDPDHVDKDGNVATAAFQTNQLLEGSLSVCRMQYSSKNEIFEQVVTPRVARRYDTKCIGVLKAICKEIRDIFDEVASIKCFNVKSDPMDNFASHGLIGFSEDFKSLPPNKSQKTQARANLMRVFGAITDIEHLPETNKTQNQG